MGKDPVIFNKFQEVIDRQEGYLISVQDGHLKDYEAFEKVEEDIKELRDWTQGLVEGVTFNGRR